MSDMLFIRGARVVDPETGRDAAGDLFIRDGAFARPPAAPPAGAHVLEARGLVAAPGFIDLHVHLREPGGEASETIETGSRAAAAGGFTTIVAMPNTRPPHDTPEIVAYVLRRAADTGLTRVLPSGAITRGRAGRELTDFAALRAAGAAALTDDGGTVQDDGLMRRALEAARALGLVVMDHAQDQAIERQGGVMHEGACSRRHGLPGIPSWAEERIIRRDIALAESADAAIHIQHVTSREGVAAIREALARGVRVTGELTPHHLALCDEDVDPADAAFKMNPPLRAREDRAALVEGLLDGTLGCFATDHAPHAAVEKARGFLAAPFGIVGLETAVGVTFTELVRAGRLDLAGWIRRWTTGPARVLGRPPPTLEPGAPADLVLLDLERAWTVDAAALHSKSKNTPFHGRTLVGQAAVTILGGRVVHKR